LRPAADDHPSIDAPSPEPTPGARPDARRLGRTQPTASPVETTTIRAYFFLGSSTHDAGLVPVLREIPKTQAVGAAAMNALLAGPNEAEMAARPAMYTTVPEGTRFLGLTIDDGVATVDLSREFESGGGSAAVLGRLAQVVYTDPVPDGRHRDLRLDGEAVTVFSGEVSSSTIRSAGPTTRTSCPIWVDRPAWGAAAGNPARVTGLSNVFEATFRIAILDADDDVLADVMAMATCGTGCWGTFDVTIPYSVDTARWGTLHVYEPSAQDGSPINVTDYPVWLTPGS
jgi:hypothetical protein